MDQVILCRMDSYCKSYGDNGSYGSCTPVEGRWQRCHQINPKPSSDQDWTIASDLESDSVLNVTFKGLKPSRRYDLSVGEFSMAGNLLRSGEHLLSDQGLSFYIDVQRPSISEVEILGDDVGKPNDKGKGGRSYTTPQTSWSPPPNSTGKWLQCNSADVEVGSGMSDQFTHNLGGCDVNGSTTSSATIQANGCGGTVTGIDQGRHTITFTPKDICEVGSPRSLTWDTDLSSSFAPPIIGTLWKYSPLSTQSAGDASYPITASVPGPFPKHYSVTCRDNFIDPQGRTDGDSQNLECKLKDGSSNNDGANLNHLAIEFHHACGQTACKSGSWGVYAPENKSCEKIECEPGLACCDASAGTCNGVSDKQCGKPQNRDCTNPKGGTQSIGDEAASGCPPLGLNDCTYTLPCKANNPFDPGETPTSHCDGLRQGQTCSFPVDGTCTPTAGTNWQSTRPSTDGIATFPGGYTEICTANEQDRCVAGTRTECRDASNNVINCPQSPQTCTPPACTSSQVQDSCFTRQYRVFAKDVTKTVSGTCGAPSGSCSAKPVGGGAANPKSTHRGECHNAHNPIQPPVDGTVDDPTKPLCLYNLDIHNNMEGDGIFDDCISRQGGNRTTNCNVSYACSNYGVVQDVPNSANHARWNCVHPSSGRIERCFRGMIHGENACWVKHACQTGLLGAINDTSDEYVWECHTIQGDSTK